MFLSLSSGSSGNSYLLSDDKTSMLIDAGITLKKLESSLKSIDISTNSISALLITHEHNDHIKGAGLISKKYDIPVFSTEETSEYLINAGVPEQNLNFIVPNKATMIGTISVLPFPIPHDAANPVGYTFETDKHKFSVATDMGKMSDENLENIKGSIAVILESNYDIEMLKNGPYPYPLKKRILGPNGHLSNLDAAKISYELVKSGTKHIMLSHLSRKNNTPEKAILETANYLIQNGITPGRDVSLRVAEPFSMTDFRCEVVSH